MWTAFLHDVPSGRCFKDNSKLASFSVFNASLSKLFESAVGTKNIIRIESPLVKPSIN